MPDEQVAIVEQTPAAPAAPSIEQRVGALKGEARDSWQLHGDLDKAEALNGTKSEVPASTESGAPAEQADVAQTEAASEPATKEQPKPRGDRDFRGLRNTLTETQKELIAAKAKLELYEKQGQSAASRPSAPATAATQLPETSDRPDYPDIGKYKTVEEFNKDVAAWKIADAKWIQGEIQKAATNIKQESVTERQQVERQQRLEQGRKEYKDFDKVAFNKDIPASDILIQTLIRHPQEHKLRYWLGTHLEEATQLAQMTHVEGLAQYQKPEAWKSLTPEQKQGVMLQIGIAQGKVDAEISRIVKNLDKPAKETTTRALPRPSTEASIVPRGTPVQDELADAIQRGDQAAYNRIQNKRDAERFKQGA
jgi:hypothetical protein